MQNDRVTQELKAAQLLNKDLKSAISGAEEVHYFVFYYF